MASFVIKHFPDELLQERVNGYYAAFAAQDIERLMSFIGDDFVMDDYRESTHAFLCWLDVLIHSPTYRFDRDPELAKSSILVPPRSPLDSLFKCSRLRLNL